MAPAETPDAELLALCAQLRGMEDEWQRLYALTSDTPELSTPADHQWMSYQNNVWPAFDAVARGWRDDTYVPNDVPVRLLELRATTVEGVAAKASAILAMDNVPGLDCRSDSYELNRSVIEDAAALRLPGAPT